MNTSQVVFHIGFHKTGTTWLQREFFSKKSHFNLLNDFEKPWNDEIIRYLIKTHLSKFDKDLFKKMVEKRMQNDKINIVSAERLSGHPISGGYDSFEIAKKISASFPLAKILIVTRKYESFITSTYKQVVKQGYVGKYDEFQKKQSWIAPGPSDYYFNQTDIVNFYKTLFTPNNILVLKFEMFQTKKQDFIMKLQSFLDLPELSFPINEIIVNRTLSNNRIRAIRFMNHFKKSDYNFPIFTLNDKWLGFIARLISPFYSKEKFHE